MSVATRSKSMTHAEAIAALDKLEATYPGGTRTPYSYRKDGHPGAGGPIALTIYKHGTHPDSGEQMYRSIDNA